MQRGGPVALLAALRPEAVEHGEHVVEPDRLRPLERPSRIVEAEPHRGVEILGGAGSALEREGGLVDELADDPPEHEPRRVADPLDVLSEPTRLRRISYAVFCLKKKKLQRPVASEVETPRRRNVSARYERMLF